MTSLELCLDSLDGLSVGDALGAQFFVPGASIVDLLDGRPPRGTNDRPYEGSIYITNRDRDGTTSYTKLCRQNLHR